MTASKRDILAYSQILIDNNKSGLVGALNINGIKGASMESSDGELREILFNLFNSNTPLFFNVTRAVKYNSQANNYTTSMNFHREIGRTPEIMRHRARFEKGSIPLGAKESIVGTNKSGGYDPRHGLPVKY